MNWGDVAVVGAAGAIGALARLAVDTAARSRIGGRSAWGTTIVNLTGTLALGVVTGVVMFHGAPAELRLAAGEGFCGGYTTFSAACFEAVRLARGGEVRSALLQTGINVFGTLAAAALGLVLAAL